MVEAGPGPWLDLRVDRDAVRVAEFRTVERVLLCLREWEVLVGVDHRGSHERGLEVFLAPPDVDFLRLVDVTLHLSRLDRVGVDRLGANLVGLDVVSKDRLRSDLIPAVREVAVFGIPDPQWGEIVAACVVLKPGTQLTVDALIRHCRQSLANYKVPRHVEFSETDLPKSGSGKILKRLLRERYWAGAQRSVGPVTA